jgi:hypothetical protein
MGELGPGSRVTYAVMDLFERDERPAGVSVVHLRVLLLRWLD